MIKCIDLDINDFILFYKFEIKDYNNNVLNTHIYIYTYAYNTINFIEHQNRATYHICIYIIYVYILYMYIIVHIVNMIQGCLTL